MDIVIRASFGKSMDQITHAGKIGHSRLAENDLKPWRKLKVTDRRTAVDFAICMRELTGIHFPLAEQIRVVLDNLSTHSPAALYNAFPAAEARRILKRLEFHFTPKHASWLNMVEIEIGVLRKQCLDRRVPSPDRIISEIAAWEPQRNDTGARIKWMFTSQQARNKMASAHPVPQNSARTENQSVIISVTSR